MDSFYDQPRCAPVPTSADKIPSSYIPELPEVSMIFQNKPIGSDQKHLASTNNCVSYNMWKARNQSKSNKENYADFQTLNTHISRKQVRFERPIPQQDLVSQSPMRSSFDQFIDKKNEPVTRKINTHVQTSNLVQSNKPKSFQEIYMANIPNRNLDLSVIEPFQNVLNDSNRTNINDSNTIERFQSVVTNTSVNKNNKIFDEIRTEFNRKNQIVSQSGEKSPNSNDNIIDVYNYKAFKTNSQVNTPASYHLRNEDVTSNLPFKLASVASREIIPQSESNTNREPSVTDLLKVIQQQNEQLMLLQKQVAVLLENKCTQKQIEAPSIDVEPNYPNKCVMSTQMEPINVCNKNVQDKTKNAIPKFAIDVMTSFEVSIRPPVNYPHRNMFNKDITHEPKIQELTEVESKKLEKYKTNENVNGRQDDVSLTFNETLSIQQGCPSPEQSIHVDMQDYSSDSDDDTSESVGNLGWTIYNNVMGQVNNILNNAEGTVKNVGEGLSRRPAEELKSKTMKKVKEATMRHLQNIGVSFPLAEDEENSKSNVTSETEYSPTEISFAVKQLLMKYLPDEQLAKIMCTQQNIPVQNLKGCGNLIKRRPEFSFATVEYMKKYNLLTTSNDMVQIKPTQPEIPQTVPYNGEMQKILDITALKRQPKLL